MYPPINRRQLDPRHLRRAERRKESRKGSRRKFDIPPGNASKYHHRRSFLFSSVSSLAGSLALPRIRDFRIERGCFASIRETFLPSQVIFKSFRQMRTPDSSDRSRQPGREQITLWQTPQNPSRSSKLFIKCPHPAGTTRSMLLRNIPLSLTSNELTRPPTGITLPFTNTTLP